MYSIADKLGVEYLVCKSRELFDGAELIIQVRWPHIVARVHRFSRIESQEERRQMLMERWEATGAEVVQVDGMRIYIEHIGALQDVGKTYIGNRLGVDGGEYVRDILNYMAVYISNQLNDGQRWALDDRDDIVDDDYFKAARKARRARRKEKSEK